MILYIHHQEIRWKLYLFIFFRFSVSDTKSAAKEEVSSPSRKMGLDGALDSDDLQSFALQIANGMVRFAYESSYAMHDLNELAWSGVS